MPPKQRNRNGSGPRNGQASKTGFDKSECSKTVVTFSNPGVQLLRSPDIGVWIEWNARPDVVGPNRRFFIGRKDATGSDQILLHGDQVPRRGMGCNLTARRVYALGPGMLTIWRPRNTTEPTVVDGAPVWDPPSGVVAPGLPAVNDGDDEDAEPARQVRRVEPPSRRLRDESE